MSYVNIALPIHSLYTQVTLSVCGITLVSVALATPQGLTFSHKPTVVKQFSNVLAQSRFSSIVSIYNLFLHPIFPQQTAIMAYGAMRKCGRGVREPWLQLYVEISIVSGNVVLVLVNVNPYFVF